MTPEWREQIVQASKKRAFVDYECRACGYRGSMLMPSDHCALCQSTDTIAPAPPLRSSLHVGISRLSLQPGDVLVVTVPKKYAEQSALDSLATSLQKILPDKVKAVVLFDYFDVKLLRADQPVVPEVDEPLTVEVPR